MLRFIINENLKNFHELLQRSTDPNERERIGRLILEAEQRLQADKNDHPSRASHRAN